MFRPNGINREQVRKLVGKNITAVTKKGVAVSGILIRIKGDKLIVRPAGKGKVRTKLFVPLVLFDLLAIGETGAYGYPFGFPGYGYGYGYGYPFF